MARKYVWAATLRAAFVAGCLLACDAESAKPLAQVVVTFDAEADTKSRAATIRIRAWSGDDDATQTYDRTFPIADEATDGAVVFPQDFPLSAENNDAARSFRLQADLFEAPGDVVPLSVVRASGQYTAGQTKRVRLRFDDACLGLLCDQEPGLTCQEGACVGSCFEPGDGREGRDAATCSSCQACREQTCEPRGDDAQCGFQNLFSCESGECSGDSIPYTWCRTRPDVHTIAHYRLDASDVLDGVFRDSVNERDGTFSKAATVGDGPLGCGDALKSVQNLWANVPDDVNGDGEGDWKLEEGSVDMLFKIDTLPGIGNTPYGKSVGLFSKDADAVPYLEYFSLWVSSEGRLLVRHQKPGAAVYVCSEKLIQEGQWVHVGVNFGDEGLELYVDGDKNTFEGKVPHREAEVTCGGDTRFGITLNPEDWVFASDAYNKPPGSTTEGIFHAPRGYIDEIRISSVRRDFAALLDVN